MSFQLKISPYTVYQIFISLPLSRETDQCINRIIGGKQVRMVGLKQICVICLPRWAAYSGRCIELSEHLPITGQSVQVGRRRGRVPVHLQVSIPQIVCKQNDHIGTAVSSGVH